MLFFLFTFHSFCFLCVCSFSAVYLFWCFIFSHSLSYTWVFTFIVTCYMICSLIDAGFFRPDLCNQGKTVSFTFIRLHVYKPCSSMHCNTTTFLGLLASRGACENINIRLIWIGRYSHMLSWFTEMQCIYCCWVGLCAAFSTHLQKEQLWKMSLTWFMGENSLRWVRYFTVLSLFADAWCVNCVINISHNFLSHISEHIIHQYQLKSSIFLNSTLGKQRCKKYQ